MKRVLNLVAVMGIGSVAWWYFGVLLVRTDFFTRNTHLGNDTIHLMYLTCVTSVLLSLNIVLRRVVRRRIGYAFLGATLIPAIGFAWLNLSETVCMQKDGSGCIPLFSKDYPLVSLVYDAAQAVPGF